MSYDKIISTMKVGFMGPFYPVPDDVPAEKKVEWLFNRAQEMGCTTMDYAFPFDDSDDAVAKLKDLMQKHNIEPDMRPDNRADGKRAVFGDDPAYERKQILKRSKSMQKLGLNIMRSGYGMLVIPQSRFNRDRKVKDHLDDLVKSLKNVAPVLEDEGMYLAIENHCDFNAHEFVYVFEEVDSPNVGCALDTGNGLTVFYDINEEYKILAPYTITTHIKDMVVIQDTAENHAPFTCCNCNLGDGHLDWQDCIETLARKSKFAKGLRLISETGASGWSPQNNHLSEEEKTKLQKVYFDTYTEKLLGYVNSKKK